MPDAFELDPLGVRQPFVAEARGRRRPGEEPVLRAPRDAAPRDAHRTGDRLGVETPAAAQRALDERRRVAGRHRPHLVGQELRRDVVERDRQLAGRAAPPLARGKDRLGVGREPPGLLHERGLEAQQVHGGPVAARPAARGGEGHDAPGPPAGGEVQREPASAGGSCPAAEALEAAGRGRRRPSPATTPPTSSPGTGAAYGHLDLGVASGPWRSSGSSWWTSRPRADGHPLRANPAGVPGGRPGRGGGSAPPARRPLDADGQAGRGPGPRRGGGRDRPSAVRAAVAADRRAADREGAPRRAARRRADRGRRLRRPPGGARRGRSGVRLRRGQRGVRGAAVGRQGAHGRPALREPEAGGGWAARRPSAVPVGPAGRARQPAPRGPRPARQGERRPGRGGGRRARRRRPHRAQEPEAGAQRPAAGASRARRGDVSRREHGVPRRRPPALRRTRQRGDARDARRADRSLRR